MQTPLTGGEGGFGEILLISIIISLGKIVFPFKDMDVMLYLLARDPGGQFSCYLTRRLSVAARWETSFSSSGTTSSPQWLALSEC